MDFKTISFVVLAIILAPIAGGLLAGVDRRLTAWLQGRFGPPILQPFYDVIKLLGKERQVVNYWQVGAELVYRRSGHDLLLPHIGWHRYDALGSKVPVTVEGEDGLTYRASSPQPLNTDGTQKYASSAPDILTRRIYPEVNFTTYFGTPPF